ncbi:hypothetical protein ASPWEDRAFT_515975 [Aspergillus wentii DTO 134E9]|uniref:Inner kinetochore subunit AME1 domain-containing protein n=1 Tax=Aspergillus wentii DTO 134E9 TaxID=1073089 RepID=A0A1L9RKZ3_ASPWE|nr:uncharacterized protein ASPWEDRAFT_515975 [Aspergillus wentii DTO 134E9]OJJ35584.1 hypothetical protein ASPWEDRAFT_515975 [Aspergillus wentii DTO 134E9]
MASNREERQQMRMRGAASRKAKEVDFGFSFGLAPGPGASSQPASQPAGIGIVPEPPVPPQPDIAAEKAQPPPLSPERRLLGSQDQVQGQRTPGSARNNRPARPSTFDIPDDAPDTGRSIKRRKIESPTRLSPSKTVRPPTSLDSSQHDINNPPPLQNGAPAEPDVQPKKPKPTPSEVQHEIIQPMEPTTTPHKEEPPPEVPDSTALPEPDVQEHEQAQPADDQTKVNGEKQEASMIQEEAHRPTRTSPRGTNGKRKSREGSTEVRQSPETTVEAVGQGEQEPVRPPVQPEVSEQQPQKPDEPPQVPPEGSQDAIEKQSPKQQTTKGRRGRPRQSQPAETKPKRGRPGKQKRARQSPEAAQEPEPEPEPGPEPVAEPEPSAPKSGRGRKPNNDADIATDQQAAEQAAQQEPEQGSQPTRKKRAPRGETVPVTVHRLVNVASLGGALGGPDAAEEEEEESADEISTRQKTKLPNRGGVNPADVLSQICRETLEKTLTTLKNGIANETNPARRQEFMRKKKAVEAFGTELDGRLLELSEMLDSNFVLGVQVKKAKREMMDMRSRLYQVRRERESVALQMDAVRKKHAEEESARQARTTINNSLHSLDLAMDRSQNRPDENEAGPATTAGLEFMLRSVGEEVSSSRQGGLLNQIKAFNAQLEATARTLER